MLNKRCRVADSAAMSAANKKKQFRSRVSADDDEEEEETKEAPKPSSKPSSKPAKKPPKESRPAKATLLSFGDDEEEPDEAIQKALKARKAKASKVRLYDVYWYDCTLGSSNLQKLTFVWICRRCARRWTYWMRSKQPPTPQDLHMERPRASIPLRNLPSSEKASHSNFQASRKRSRRVAAFSSTLRC